jgi:hypothetical protein
MSGYGSQAMWGDLERVLVRPPLPVDANHVERYGWRGVPDVAAAAAEHDELRALLEAAGAEVIVSEHDPGNPDAICTYDPTLVGAEGAVLLLPGKGGRRAEPEATIANLARHPPACCGSSRSAGSQWWRCPTRSSRPWAPTCSRSGPGARSR